MTRKNVQTQRLVDVIQINGKTARDCTARECVLRPVAAAYRAADETKRIEAGHGGPRTFVDEQGAGPWTFMHLD